MDEAADISMSFDNDDNQNQAQLQQQPPSSPHNTKDTALVIDSSDSENENGDEGFKKLPTAASTLASSLASKPMILDASQSASSFARRWGQNTSRTASAGRFSSAAAVSAAAAASGSGSRVSAVVSAAAAASGSTSNNNNVPLGGAGASLSSNTSSFNPITNVKSESMSGVLGADRSYARKVSMSPTPNNNNDTTRTTSAMVKSRAAARKPFGCNDCNERFWSSRKLKRHEKKCIKKLRKKVKSEKVSRDVLQTLKVVCV